MRTRSFGEVSLKFAYLNNLFRLAVIEEFHGFWDSWTFALFFGSILASFSFFNFRSCEKGFVDF